MELPFSLNLQKYKKSIKDGAQAEKKEKKLSTSCSQQSLANNLILSTMPQNPNTPVMQNNPIPAK